MITIICNNIFKISRLPKFKNLDIGASRPKLEITEIQISISRDRNYRNFKISIPISIFKNLDIPRPKFKISIFQISRFSKSRGISRSRDRPSRDLEIIRDPWIFDTGPILARAPAAGQIPYTAALRWYPPGCTPVSSLGLRGSASASPRFRSRWSHPRSPFTKWIHFPRRRPHVSTSLNSLFQPRNHDF